MFILLLLVAVFVGGLIGTVGAGGILIIPLLGPMAGLSTHQAMGTALFSFLFTGMLGTFLYRRHGSISWGITIPVCLGSVLFAFPGAQVNALVQAEHLNVILGCLIIFAGAYALFPAKGGTVEYRPGDTKQKLLLLGIGAVVGFFSGLTGVGGPVLSVPLMVIAGFAPLACIATSQVIQIAAASSGSLGNLMHGAIDLEVGAWITAAELAGVFIGVRIAHRVSQRTLKRIVSVVCIIVGLFVIVRSV
ncbi:MAG: sulfite exporter TauE/SafE family protein [Desulfovibrionaceae bacterium]|nr:sulfite exporter TauE/SafE family protein [Desulfovibrionaceae bacterium]